MDVDGVSGLAPPLDALVAWDGDVPWLLLLGAEAMSLEEVGAIDHVHITDISIVFLILIYKFF